MKPPLHVLIVDDSADDAQLIVRELTLGGYDVTSLRVETADALQRALVDGPWEVVLCDFSLPRFSGEAALRLVKASGRELPFVFVSGTIGEEIAVGAMKAGADDYVMKDRLPRLVPAIARELRETEVRKRAELGLRKQTRMNQALFNQAITCFVLIGRDYRIIQVNESFASYYGKSPDYFSGRDVREVRSAEQSIEDSTAMIDEVVRTKMPMRSTSFPYRFADQPERITYWDAILQPILDEHGDVEFLFFSSIDVTERMEAEGALRASEQRFRQVTENIDEVFWLTDTHKNEMIYISPAYSRVWGRTCESLTADPRSWIDAIHPDDRERVREIALTLQTSGAYDVEYRIVRPDGVVRWVHDRAFPIRDAADHVYRIAGVAEDITERRHLEDQLRQSQKMEAIGRLAGGVAHDFNNLLAVIQMQCSLLLTAPASVVEMQEGLQQILASSERAANLTRQLLTFSRRDVWQARDIDLADVTGGMTKLLRRILGEDLALETRIAHALPLVNADPGMMEQVLMNLAVNARDAMPNGGRLVISLDVAEIGADEVAGHAEAVPGRFVRLVVKDSGCGIDPDDVPHIFEPFFTTKEAGKGTGLGLATVFGIIEQHHGWIDVTSEVGRGTTFAIFLPALPDSRAAARREIRASTLPNGTESILLVEDDPAVRKLARVSLEHCGYRVHEADSPETAIALWETLQEPVDLLFTDLIMPGGMSGRELAEHLVERQPGLKVLYSSGYSNDIVRPELHLTPGYNFLQKPYHLNEMATTVRRCLDER
jgi:two-component system cell cycle sensor histidine kinase/response regulator CckA